MRKLVQKGTMTAMRSAFPPLLARAADEIGDRVAGHQAEQGGDGGVDDRADDDAEIDGIGDRRIVLEVKSRITPPSVPPPGEAVDQHDDRGRHHEGDAHSTSGESSSQPARPGAAADDPRWTGPLAMVLTSSRIEGDYELLAFSP
jgi:hypothetical protein